MALAKEIGKFLTLAPLRKGIKKIGKSIKSGFQGTPEVRENVSTLRPEQEPLYQQAVDAGLHPGAGGAFGDAADYYRGNLSENPEDFDKFAAPALRQYKEDIVPGLSEQFAGMGAGGLSSSGFQNAQNQGAVDLAERLGSIRANLRQSSAQGLQNVGQIGLNPYSQNMTTQPGTEGFLTQALPAVTSAALTAGGAYIGGPAGAAAGMQAGDYLGQAAGNWLRNRGSSQSSNSVGANRGPYQSENIAASPQINNPYAQSGGGGFQLPNFSPTRRGF